MQYTQADASQVSETVTSALAWIWLSESIPMIEPARESTQALLAQTGPSPELLALASVYEGLAIKMLPASEANAAARARLPGLYQLAADSPYARVRLLAQAIATPTEHRDLPGVAFDRTPFVRLGDEELQALPPVERVIALMTAANQRRHDGQLSEALRFNLRAQAIKLPDELQAFQVHWVRYALALMLLNVGELEGSRMAFEDMVAWYRRVGQPHGGAVSQLITIDLVEGAFDQARERMLTSGWLQGSSSAGRMAARNSREAWIRARTGEPERARALLADPEDDLPQQIDWIGSVTAYSRSNALLAIGEPRRARAVAEGFIRRAAEQGYQPTPINGTQLFLAYAEACEALGDFPASVQALKQSKAHCFRWAGESVEMKLTSLHFLAQGVDAALQQQRLTQLRGATAQARPHRYVATVAHELRNPIGAMMGTLSLLQLDAVSDRQRQLLDLADHSARMLLNLCNDLLDLAQLDAGKLSLRPADVDIGGTLRTIAKQFDPMAQVCGVQLLIELDPRLPPTVHLDPMRLQQLVMNLLNNALKFTQSGSVQLRASRVPVESLGSKHAARQLRIEVEDSGPGMSEAAMGRLFQEFSQVHATHAPDAPKGTGLGLALCKRLVHQMGGEIGVRSQLGLGSTFWLELPLNQAAEPPPR